MKKIKLFCDLLFIALLFCTYCNQSAYAAVEWTLGKQLSLDAAPLDIASSSDGQWIYLLTPGEIAIYSVLDDKVVSRIPIDKAFARVFYIAQTNSLIVSSGTGKTLRFINLEFIQKFAFDGLAFKGPENAPVTIAVFSDYQ